MSTRSPQQRELGTKNMATLQSNSSELLDKLRCLLANPLQLHLLPVDGKPSFIAELVDADYSTGSVSKISTEVLRRLKWKNKSTFPSVGTTIELSVRHGVHGNRVLIQFLVSSEPQLGVVIGKDDCDRILDKWKDDERLILYIRLWKKLQGKTMSHELLLDF